MGNFSWFEGSSPCQNPCKSVFSLPRPASSCCFKRLLFLLNNNRKDKMKVRRRRSSRLWRLMGGSERGSERHPPLVQVESNIEEWPVFQLGRSKTNSALVER